MARTGRGGPAGKAGRKAGDKAPTASSLEARAVADEVSSENTRGASRGTEQKGPRSSQRPEEAREGADSAAVADFAQELADMAAADPADTEGAKESDHSEAFGDDLEVEGEVEIEKEDMAKARPARTSTVLPGGEDDPDEAPPPPPTPEEAPAVAPEGSPIPRVRPRARAAWLGLDIALEAGLAEAILYGWQARVAAARVEDLTSDEWLALVRAMRIARSPIAQALVVKALGANRDPSVLPAFASRVVELGAEEAVSLLHRRGPVPGPEADIRALRLHYDPVEALDPREPREEAAPEEPWRVPAWLSGIPRAALELAAVAVDQALSNDLRPGEPTDDGATDALTAALSPHGRAHPSLQRWCLNLAARAETREGLVKMRVVMMQARGPATK